MSTVEYMDDAIKKIVDNLVKEYEQTGFLSVPSDDRKAQIIDQIAKLRASMSPQCDCKK